jgi:molybdenum cofactor cytidylyltransferase
LAAGASRRLGRIKQLLSLGGSPLLAWPLAAMRQYGPRYVVVVLGHEAEAITRAVDLDGVAVVVNPLFAGGLSTSLQAGVASLGAEVSAAVICSGDQPFISAAVFRQLQAIYERTGQPIVATDYGDYRGVPVLLDRSVWPRLGEITGDQGARVLLRAYPGATVSVPIPDSRMALDVDTMDQFLEASALVDRLGLQPPVTTLP